MKFHFSRRCIYFVSFFSVLFSQTCRVSQSCLTVVFLALFVSFPSQILEQKFASVALQGSFGGILGRAPAALPVAANSSFQFLVFFSPLYLSEPSSPPAAFGVIRLGVISKPVTVSLSAGLLLIAALLRLHAECSFSSGRVYRRATCSLTSREGAGK